MATNGSVTRTKNQGHEVLLRILALLVFLVCSMRCTHADIPDEYRESQGKVAKFSVDLSDPVLRVTEFLRLQDGSVIRPKVFYYKTQRILFRPRRVEESARTFRTLGRDVPATHRVLYLPTSEEIATYLILVRKSFPKEVEKDGKRKTEYIWADWQLLEIKSEDISSEKPLVIPAFEELTKRELTKEQKELLTDLVQRYDNQAAAARKKAATPVKPGDKKPWWRW